MRNRVEQDGVASRDGSVRRDSRIYDESGPARNHSNLTDLKALLSTCSVGSTYAIDYPKNIAVKQLIHVASWKRKKVGLRGTSTVSFSNLCIVSMYL